MNDRDIPRNQPHEVGRPWRRMHPLQNLTLWLSLLLALGVVALISAVPLTLEQQLVFALCSLLLALLIRRGEHLSRYQLLVLMMISVVATGRYMYWRITDSMGWFNPGADVSAWDNFLAIGLLLAEGYAWTVLFLGYFQTLWPLNRPVVDLPADQSLWPTVDVFIPTYDEPLKVVAPSIIAARDLDWPRDKLRVYVLDDGCRQEFREFAEQAGVHYIERRESRGAKAGNINHALAQTNGELVAIFDSDHVPTRPFLKKTVGWFLHDPKLGLLQTPHLFFTPDPVERNLQIFHRVPNEGQLFYGLVQDGNDTWNAAFFCGSCAVLSRDALEDIGGVAEDTVTEDAHTSLLMQKKGWNSAYINTPLAAGMATERLSAHIRQRIRWARGMTQIFRRDNPLFARGMSVAQRLNYFNAMLHFFFGLPRLVFLTAPLAYLFFETYVIQASAAMIAVYALPHIFQAHIANSAMQGRFRHSYWAEVFETLLAPHIFLPTLVTFFFPDKGKFNVTQKGGIIEKDHFDWSSSKYIFLLLVLNIAGLIIGVLRLFWWNPDETGTVVINLGWTLFNSIIIGAALAVGWEKRQRRANARIRREFPALLRTVDGYAFQARTADISTGDLSLEIDQDVPVRPSEFVIVELLENDTPHRFKGRVATVRSDHIGIKLERLSAQKLADLVYFSHTHDHAWDQWYTACPPVKPLTSFLEIVRFGIIGAFRALFGHNDDPEGRLRPGYSMTGWLLVIIIVTLTGLFAPRQSHAAATATPPATMTTLAPAATGGEAGWREVALPFSALGVTKPIRLRGGNTQHDVWFSLRADRIAKGGEIRLRYSLSPDLRQDYRSLRVALNGITLGELPLEEFADGQQRLQRFAVDPLYISDVNQLSLRLVPREVDFCEKLDPKLKEALILPDSEVRMTIGPLDLVNELALFPVPFFDRHDNSELTLPFVFDRTLSRSPGALRAAAILASWFGAQADRRGIRFPAVIDALPDRHAIVLATPASHYDFLPPLPMDGPGVAIVSHPRHSHVKLLVVYGRDERELVEAAATLVGGRAELAGARVTFTDSALPPPRAPYDAPRWLRAGERRHLGDIVDPQRLGGRGLNPDPVVVPFRLAPDLYKWQQDTVPLVFQYRYTDLPLRRDSVLAVDLDHEGLRAYPLGARKGIFSSARPFPDELPDPAHFQPTYIEAEETIPLPLAHLRGDDELSFFFDYQIPDKYGDHCITLYTEFMRGDIDPDSFLDLRGFRHFIRMPELAAFASLGFPFTRHPDLADTAVVMPHRPEAADLQVLLEVAGKMGIATGYPVYHVQVVFPDSVADVAQRHLLLIGPPDRQDLLARWQGRMPLVHDESGQWRPRPLGWGEKLHLWWQGRDLRDARRLDELFRGGPVAVAGLASFRSPLDADHTVLAFVSERADQAPAVVRALLDPAARGHFHGDLTLLTPDGPLAYRVLPSYQMGRLPPVTQARWYLSTHLAALLLLSGVLILLTAWVLKVKMKHYAENRLASTLGEDPAR